MKVILTTILLLGASETSYAKEWRGIVPLRSTRSDVVRLLNQCSDQSYEWTLTSGRIISGQYTKQVTIDTTGLAGQKITVTAEIEDGSRHRVSGSITVEILAGK